MQSLFSMGPMTVPTCMYCPFGMQAGQLPSLHFQGASLACKSYAMPLCILTTFTPQVNPHVGMAVQHAAVASKVQHQFHESRSWPRQLFCRRLVT